MKCKKILALLCLSMAFFACSNNKTVVKKKPLTKREAAIERAKKRPIDNAYSLLDGKHYPKIENNYGKEVPYLQPINETEDEDFFEKYNEAKVLKFFKDRNVKGYGSNSRYWRWKTSLSKKALFQKIAKKLPQISARGRRNVFVLENGVWIKNRRITNVGRVKNIKVLARGASGVITHLLVETTKGKYLVTKEYNIRRLLASNGKIYGASYGKNYHPKPISNGSALLPSAYLAFEIKGSRATIYGGGFGHGAGMMQYGAGDMAKNYGFSYKKILHHYYTDIDIVDMKKVKGVEQVIRVGITRPGASLNHKVKHLQSPGKVRVYGKGFDYTFPKNTDIRITPKNGRLYVHTRKKSFWTRHPVIVASLGEKITIKNLRKSHTRNPQYRGKIQCNPKGNYMHMISLVDMEDYLKQVVPSEMPRSFGVEALKVQAIAARTYAISDFLKGRYAKLGFHVKDTTESQVYNNQWENADANKAIAETKGKIMVHKGRPIDAKYSSTSSGMTEAAHHIW